jgi:small subunit ribosomal protein S21
MFMIIVEVKRGEPIEKALKRYKFKVMKTRQLEKLRSRQEYTKKSVSQREQKQKAIYKEKQREQDL